MRSCFSAGAISTRSLSQAKLNRQFETAIACAEKQLAMVDYIGIDDFINSCEMQGDTEEFDADINGKLQPNLTKLRIYILLI